MLLPAAENRSTSERLQKVEALQRIIESSKEKTGKAYLKLRVQQTELLNLEAKSIALAERAKQFDKTTKQFSSTSSSLLLPALALGAIGFGLYRLKRYFD